MDSCLKKGADARRYSVILHGLEYSGDLSDSLLKFSTKMEKVYHHVQDLVKRNVTNPSSYEKHFNIIDERMQWYEKAEVRLFKTACF